MAANEIQRKLSLDVGIERVLSSPQPEQPSLPDMGQVLPGDDGYQLELERVLYPDSLEQALLRSLKPEVKHRDLLSATRFQAAVEQAQEGLRKTLAQIDSREDRKKIRRAIDVLEEMKGLRDLLNAYRHVLHRA